MADDLLPKLGQLALGGAAAPSADGSSSPPPPLAAAAVPPPMPLGTVLDPLLATKSLDPVDLLTLGCVNKDLSLRVREFWAQAEKASPPGTYQARFFSNDESGEVFHSASYAHWRLNGTDKQLLAYGTGTSKTLDASRRPPILQPPEGVYYCCCCERTGREPGSSRVAYEFIFDAAGGQPLELCADCFCSAQSDRPPAHSRAARFRLAPCNELMELYQTPLPLSIVESAAVDMRLIEGATVVLAAGPDVPLACVRRVAAYALMKRTPRALQEHWKREKAAGPGLGLGRLGPLGGIRRF